MKIEFILSDLPIKEGNSFFIDLPLLPPLGTDVAKEVVPTPLYEKFKQNIDVFKVTEVCLSKNDNGYYYQVFIDTQP